MSDNQKSQGFDPEVQHAHILVCDDDADTRSIVKHAVEALGHAVVEADDGQTAMAMVQNELPDLIIMDVMMPTMTGMEFTSWFRSAVPDVFIPVIFLTALSDVDNRVEGFAVGGDDYLIKPFHYRELQARVQSHLRIKFLTEKLVEQAEILRATNEELQKTQQALVQKERALAVAELAGAAAHHLGQPATTILLQCHLLEKALSAASADEQGRMQLKGEDMTRIRGAQAAIREQCETLRNLLSQLKDADANQTTSYVGDISILDIQAKK